VLSFLARIFISPSEPRLRALWRLLIQGLSLLVLMVLFSIFVAIGLFFGLSQTAVTIFSEFGSLLAITLTVYLARRLLDRRSFVSLGLHIDQLALWDILAGFLISGLLMGAIFILEMAFGWLHVEGFDWQTQSLSTVLLTSLAVLVIFIVVAWQEELLFRGYQLQNLSDSLNLFWGVVLSSFFFAVLHLANPSASWTSVVGIFGAGLFLAYGYVRTRQLWLPIGLHIGWNFFEGPVFGFPVSGLDFYRLTHIQVSAPDLFSGGAFGPEAGLIVLPALALGALLVFAYTKYFRRDRTIN